MPAHSKHWTLARRLRSRDEGIAMASVMILGMILAILAMVIVARATSNYTVTDSDRRWEQSLFTAESGLDSALVELEKDEDFGTVPVGTDLATRDKVIAVAEVLAVDPANRISTTDGEVVVVKIAGVNEVFAVGASPNWDVSTRKVRVVHAELTEPAWSPPYNILINGDLKVEAKKKDKDVEMLGTVRWAHANGKIEAKINDDEGVIGCLTGWGNGAPGQKFSDGDPPCPAAADVQPVEVPDIDPMKVHYLAQYDICPDGTIRHGPASGHAFAAAPEEPCTGAPVADPESFEIKDWDEGDKRVEFESKKTKSGIYFLYGRSAKVKTDHSVDEYYLTLIATKPNNDLQCRHVIPGSGKIDKEQYGDIEVDSHRSIRAHPDAKGYLFVTSGDVKLKLKHKLIGEARGMIFAREQVKLELQDATDPDDNENADKGGLRGFVVAQHACDTKDSKLDKNRSELKKGDIIYDGQYGSAEFTTEPPVAVVTRREL